MTAQTFAVTRNAFDNIGRLVYTVSEGVVTQYQYDIYSRLSDVYTGLAEPVEQPKFSDAAHTSYTYDYAGRKNTETDPLGKTETFVFDDFGRMTSSIDKMGQTTAYQYDGAGRIKKTTAGNTITLYYYDYLGNVVETAEGGNTIEYVYDAFDRAPVEVEDSRTGVTHLYTYSDSGVKLSYTMKKGNTTLTSERYEYDKAHRPIKTFVNGEMVASRTYGYHKNGAVASETKGPVTSTYQYDTWGRQAGISTYTLSASVNYLETAQHTFGGNVYHSETTSGTYGSTADYTYDSLGRLTSESGSDGITKAYQYDNAGNRSHMQVSQNGINQYQVGYAYDKANQLLSQTTYTADQTVTQTYLYDPNGNMTGKLGYGGGISEEAKIETQQEFTTQTYVYDRHNRLTSVKQGESVVGTYTYGMGGLRAGKTAGQTTAGHVWEGMNMKAQTDTNGSITELYFYGPTGLIARQIGGQMQYYVKNMHGDVVILTDAQGNVIQDYTDKPGAMAYDAFGNQKLEKADDNPFRYCAEYYDAETTFIYLRARYYDPNIGRFITEDPIKDGMNWYTYCAGNPINRIDPSGMLWKELGDFGRGFVSGVTGFLGSQWNAISALPGQMAEIGRAFRDDPMLALQATASFLGDMDKIYTKALVIDPLVFVGKNIGEGAGAMLTGNYYDVGNRSGQLTTFAAELYLGAKVMKGAKAIDAKMAAGTKYGPMNQGPLKPNIANSFRSSSYTQRISSGEYMHRVHGGTANPTGSFLSRTPQYGGMQAQLDLALNPSWGNTATNVSKVYLPKGTVFFEGYAAPQAINGGNGMLMGGGSQIYVP